MAHIGAADPENHIFRDVGRVIRNPLKVASDHERMQSLRECILRLFP